MVNQPPDLCERLSSCALFDSLSLDLAASQIWPSSVSLVRMAPMPIRVSGATTVSSLMVLLTPKKL